MADEDHARKVERRRARNAGADAQRDAASVEQFGRMPLDPWRLDEEHEALGEMLRGEYRDLLLDRVDG
jgi:hypothetical protein